MEFILGYNPFSNPGEPVNLLLAIKGTPVSAALNHPHPVMQLARRMMAEDANARPSIDEVLSSPASTSVLFTSLHTICVAESVKETEMRKEIAALKAEKDVLKAEVSVLRGEIKKEGGFLWSAEFSSQCYEVSSRGKTVRTTCDGDNIILIGNRKITHGVAVVSVKVKISSADNNLLGVLPELAEGCFDGKGFGKTGVCFDVVPGWGLNDCKKNKGIFSLGKKVAESTVGFETGDTVTMRVDVGRGDLEYSVNGTKCAELKNVAEIKNGLYMAASVWGQGDEWTIISSEYIP